jgi:predicted nucleotidyltransferase
VSETDFTDFIRILKKHRARFLVIGGYAMAHHGLVRATNDVDVLIATDPKNVARIRKATLEFVGTEPSPAALTPPRGMFRIGPEHVHVDVTTKIDGIRDFQRAWEQGSSGEFFGVRVRYLGVRDMIRTKRASGRPKDLGDLDFLLRLRR